MPLAPLVQHIYNLLSPHKREDYTESFLAVIAGNVAFLVNNKCDFVIDDFNDISLVIFTTHASDGSFDGLKAAITVHEEGDEFHVIVEAEDKVANGSSSTIISKLGEDADKLVSEALQRKQMKR